MTDDVMLNEAIEAIRQGQRQRARDLLTRLLRNDQNNPTYWLWMSAVVETVKERIFCLQTVLQFEPDNKAAKLGLIMAGAIPPEETTQVTPPMKRKWDVSIPREAASVNFKKYLSNPIVRLFALIFAVLIIGGGVWAWRSFSARPSMVIHFTPTETPLVYPTFTATPTYIGYQEPTATATLEPVSGSPTPLWMLLEATYTPTPLYVNTPHPRSEAYRTAQRAFLEGDWEKALEFFDQALTIEPEAADIQYFIGETHRFSGQPQLALQAYNRALVIDSNFAPAYLGKAQASLTMNPEADVEKDLNKAINSDPSLAEAYLERAAFYLSTNQDAKAQKDIDSASELLPDSPLPYYYQAKAALEEGDSAAALEFAQKAYDLDQTLLPVYQVLGEAALQNNDFKSARQKLDMYLLYEPENAAIWLSLGRAYAALGSYEQLYTRGENEEKQADYEKALEAINQATQMNSRLPGIFIYRAWIYLLQGESNAAVNEFLDAKKTESEKINAGKLSTLWFPINLGLGQALLLEGRANEAYGTLNYAAGLAENDYERAAIYFWRAQAGEQQEKGKEAVKDWEALMELPEGIIPQEWLDMAVEHLDALSTPTPTPKVSQTPTRTPRPTATSTPQASPTDAVTKTQPATLTPEYSPTP
ncbi:MAG: tetratricopeptide repeat protein [Anaerolineales bacterium]|nr:tetratricopeptide repeat protein [Anaerolineales bacterium]